MGMINTNGNRIRKKNLADKLNPTLATTIHIEKPIGESYFTVISTLRNIRNIFPFQIIPPFTHQNLPHFQRFQTNRIFPFSNHL